MSEKLNNLKLTDLLSKNSATTRTVAKTINDFIRAIEFLGKHDGQHCAEKLDALASQNLKELGKRIADKIVYTEELEKDIDKLTMLYNDARILEFKTTPGEYAEDSMKLQTEFGRILRERELMYRKAIAEMDLYGSVVEEQPVKTPNSDTQSKTGS